MQANLLLKKLKAELEVNKLGDHRKFKFINEHLNNVEKTILFFIKHLGYKRWQANNIAYSIEHRKKTYKKQKLNTSTIDKAS